MKIILNPKYEFLRDYLMNLETHFENEGEEIHRGRNVIKKLSVGDLRLCVKKFAPPATTRRLKEMFYKSSKGKQAYLRPMLLRERGFESPENVAFVSYRKGLFRTIGYFVCLLSNYRYTMAEIDQCTPEEKKNVVEAFARFAAYLHEDGFLHRDFSSSNVLYDKVGDRYHFSLIDTNSMKCGRAVSLESGCRNLAQLSGDEDFFHLLAQTYASLRHAEPERCERLINEARKKRA